VLSTGNPHTHSLYTQLPPLVSDGINNTTFRFNDSIEDAFIWSNNKNNTYTTKSDYNWLLSLRDPISTHNIPYTLGHGYGNFNFWKRSNFSFGWLAIILCLPFLYLTTVK
jgi:hypothetical protein